MTASTQPLPFTLAIHPTTRGFGWIVFEGPFRTHAYGLVYAAKDLNTRCLRRVDQLIVQFAPETIALEAYERHASRRRNRTARLGRAIVALAKHRNVDAAIYRHADVQACFATVGARTRWEIAEAVARHNDVLRRKLPKKRQIWTSEDRRMALFAAAALVLTHYHFAASDLLDDLVERSPN